MQLLISDANILIDMEEGQLMNDMFRLPYAFRVPDVLYFEEMEDMGANWLSLGLELGVLSGDSVSRVSPLIRKYPKPSRNDCLALVLAQQEQCPLLTGDKALRQAAELEGVLVQGTLWLVGQMVVHGLISVEEAKNSYQRMQVKGRRLPWNLALQRLNDLQDESL